MVAGSEVRGNTWSAPVALNPASAGDLRLPPRLPGLLRDARVAMLQAVLVQLAA